MDNLLTIMQLSYVETALWSTGYEDIESLDEKYAPEDLDILALRQCDRDCKAFYEQCKNILTEQNASHWGHDFWLTRNGHGAGFWDGDYPEHGDALTKAAESFGDVHLYVGDDEKIHIG